MSSCAVALSGLREVLYQCDSSELGALAGDLAQLRALAGAALVAVVAEAESRGVVAESQLASTAAWVADCAWHSRWEAAMVAKAARLARRPDMAPVVDSLLTVDIDPGTAVVIAAEFDKLAPDLKPEAKPVVLDLFCATAASYGSAQVRRLREEILANYGANGEFEDHTEKCRRFVELSTGRQTSAGLWEYCLTLDGESRSVLEAAIGPLSAPRPDPETGVLDPRPVGLRRGHALIDALRRSVSAAGHVPTSPKAVLTVTIDFADLVAQLGAGTVLGTRAGGSLLSPDAVRKLACDGGIIPTVLGSDGEILDQGRMVRLFTTSQVRALWLRDRHCSFPGCDAPAAWCDSHHLTHWIDGGATSLDDGALLCAHHHTVVHRDRLAGVVTPQGVSWDVRPGSYRQCRPSRLPDSAGGTPPGANSILRT